MLAPDLNTVRLDVAPGDLQVIEQYAAAECPPSPVAFCRRKPIALQHIQNPCEEGIILGDQRPIGQAQKVAPPPPFNL